MLASALILVLSWCSVCVADQVMVLEDIFRSLNYSNKTPVNANNVCGSWTGIRVECDTSGTIRILNFTDCSLDGTLPESLPNLTSIDFFSVQSNKIHGTIPSAYSSLGLSLRTFIIGKNRVSGTIPESFSNWTNIVTFQVNNNNLTGTVPSSFRRWKHIVDFGVSNNSMIGTLPSELSEWSSIVNFDVSSNRLSGTLPDEYRNFTTVNRFFVDDNYLSGTIPVNYFMMRAMIRFSVSDNMFDGTLPEQFSVWNVTSFEAESNQLTGTLPNEYSQWASIEIFSTQNNSLSGTLPRDFSNWTIIRHFSVKNNFITGVLPSTYADWSRVEYFGASNNLITGTLPEIYCNWGSMILRIFLLHNQLEGSIPLLWARLLKGLRSFSVSNNSLSGTIPAFKSPLLLVLAVSSNNFSGTLPTLMVFSLFLDAQNNTLLSGPVPLGIVSACGTQLWKLSVQVPPLLRTVCFPPDYSGLLDNIDDATLDDLDSYNFTLQVCCPTPSPVTVLPTLVERVNISLAPEVDSTKEAAAIVTATVIMSAISAIDASDAQMLAAVLSSPCTCQNGALSTTTSTSSTTMLGLSLFSPLGFEWSIVGNVLLCLTLIAVHGLCVMAMPKPNMNAQSDVSSIETPRPSRLTWWRNTPHYRETLEQISRLQFPNVSVAMVLLLAPGVVRGVVNISQNFANASEEKNDSSVRLRIVAIVVGIVFLACTMLCLELIVYQHIDDEMVNLEDRTLPSSSAAMRKKRGMTHHQRRFYYAPYQQIVKVFAPVPRLVALIALPRGYWGPDAARNSYGGLVSKFIERWRRAWVVLPISNLIVQILSEIEDQCSVTQSLTLCILLATCIFFFTAVPHRAQLSSYLTCLSTSLTFVVAVLALACRLEPNDVSMNDVSSVGVFASLVAMLCQVYNIALPFVEQWLLRRNGAIPLPLLTDTQSSNSSFQHTMKEAYTTKTSLPIKSARTLIHHHPAEPQRVEEVSVRQNQRQQRQRLLALRELIELVCSTSQEPASLSQLWCVQ